MSKDKSKRGPGRPRVADKKVSSHVRLSESERNICNAAASMLGLPFSTWSRMRLLDDARSTLATSTR